MNRIFAALVLAAVAAARASAAPPLPFDGKWWKNPRVVRELALTSAQVDRIEKIFLRVRPELIDLRADFEKKRLEQESAMDDPKIDGRDAERRIDAVEDARAKLAKARAAMFLEIRDVLTPEQRQKILDRRERRRMRGAGFAARGPIAASTLNP